MFFTSEKRSRARIIWNGRLGVSIGVIFFALALSPFPTIAQPDVGWEGASLVDLHLQGRALDPQVAMDANGNAMVIWSQDGGTNTNIWANRYVSGIGWQSARVIEDLGGDAGGPQVAVDAAGNAVAVWRHGLNVYANRYVSGSGWGTPTALETDPRFASEPQVAMDPGGNATAVWLERDAGGINNSVYASRSLPGSEWDPPVALEASNVSAGSPQVAMDAGGCATAVWMEFGTTLSIVANRFTPGSGWETAIRIDAGLGTALHPQVAMDASGHAMAVWSQHNGTENSAYASRYVPGSGWEAATLLEFDTGGVGRVQVGMDDNAHAIAVWSLFEAPNFNIYANIFRPGFGWEAAAMIDTGANNSFDPQVSVAAGGNASAVWREHDGTDFSIYANQYDVGTGWGSRALIESRSDDAREPQVAVDDSGDAVAVWRRDDAVGGSIYANRHASGAWGSATLIEHDDWRDALGPTSVASDPEGNAIAVWSQHDGGSFRILAGRFEPGRGWGIPESIEAGQTFSVGRPSVAADASGRAVVVWIQDEGGYASVFARHYTPGAGWGTATPIDAGPFSAENPRVSIAADGRAMAVWSQSDGTDFNAYANSFTPGTGWGGAILLETDPNSVSAVQVAMGAGGNAVAVWEQSTGGVPNIYANRYVLGSGWEGPEEVDAGAGSANIPHVAIDDSGRAIVVWQQTVDTSSSIYANRHVPGGGWEGPTEIDAGTHSTFGTRVAMDTAGHAVAVWTQEDGLFRSIYANRYVPGTGWGTAALLETGGGDAFGPPQVNMNAGGSLVAAWGQSNGTIRSIYASRYVPGTGWSSATLLEASANEASFPQVAMDGSGNAFVVWQQADENRGRIYANRFVSGTRIPQLDITSPTESITNNGEVTLAGRTDPGAGVTIDGAPVDVDVGGVFSATMSLSDGAYTFEVVATNAEGESNTAFVTITVDTAPPSLVLTSPADGATTEVPTVTVTGTTEPGARVVVNGIIVVVGSGGGFAVELALVEGDNVVSAAARDAAGNLATASLSITFLNPLPGLEQDLQDTQDELDVTRDTLGTTQDTLGSTQDEVDAAQALLAAQGTQLLVSLVLLVVFAGLTGFLIVVYLRGRFKA